MGTWVEKVAAVLVEGGWNEDDDTQRLLVWACKL